MSRISAVEEAGRVSEHESIERKPGPAGSSPAKTRSLAARRSQFRLGVAVMFAIFAGPQFSGRAAGQTIDTRNLDAPAMQAGKAELFLHVTLVEGKSKNFRISEPFEDVVVGAPAIADAVPVSDQQLYILGKQIGTTNVLVYGPNKRLIGIVDVTVTLDTRSLGAKIREASGDKDIHVDDVDGKIVLRGSSGDPQTVQRAMQVAAGLAPGGVVNALKITTPQQVMLKVRFVEADRVATRNLGIRWAFFKKNGNLAGVVGTKQGTALIPANGNFPSSTTFPNNTPNSTPTQTSNSVLDVVPGAGGLGSPFATIITQIVNSHFGSVDAVLSALEEQNVLRQLAQPDLIALSGQTASFLAGGEVPIPVVSSAAAGGLPTITIEYHDFGVKLNFTPTVLSRGVISLKLAPEVSSIDETHAVTIGGVSVP
ncbi:MAG: type II and III secretion system protein family protein, partial [Methylocella sp.]